MLKQVKWNDIALLNKSSQSYEVLLAIWDHTVLPVTRHKWTHPALTPARQAGNHFTYPGGMKSWADLGDWLHTEMVYPPARPNSNPAVHGRESQVRCHNYYTTKPDNMHTLLQDFTWSAMNLLVISCGWHSEILQSTTTLSAGDKDQLPIKGIQ